MKLQDVLAVFAVAGVTMAFTLGAAPRGAAPAMPPGQSSR